ncbi:MAG TPA: acyl-CoA dehydrogenase family protein [Solirubrobacteraceae bacterium]|jgi:alkylation response protein AidB-like acyl-CoA dehydrogenase|nr:acyl-CoA dehydrogenase family protein [Solirubrobacteraceae bacterium]
MNFDFTDDQQAIKRTARDFLQARYKPELVRELADSERGYTDEQWTAVRELGWPGVMIDEQHGGLGLGAVELIVIQEELGYALAPTPLLSSVAAGLLVEAAGSADQKARWLEPLASGEARAAVALWDERSGWSPAASKAELSSGTLSTTKIAVADAAGADLLVVSGHGSLFLVPADASGVQIELEPSLDPTRKLHRVTFEGVPAEPMTQGSMESVSHAYSVVVTALAAENVGIAQRTMEMAVEYAKDRKQFDRPIGAYQAVAHRCAQMLLEVEGARSLTYGAAWALDHEPETAVRAASMAKAYAGDAGFRVSASALQVHGGIGFTWEHDLHFFLKRAKANAHAYGDARWHRERVAELSGP